MLNYQTTSFHDALYARKVLGLNPAPEFKAWLEKMEIFKDMDNFILNDKLPQTFSKPLSNVIGQINA
jgi:ethanolamine ammonia-lyase large subunit